MSDPAAALGGARFEGLVTVEEAAPQGMITLRAPLAEAKAAIEAATGVALPEPNTIHMTARTGLAWMSPDELMMLCPPEEAAARAVALAEALGGHHALVVDVSQARAVLRVSGAPLRDVLSKLTPADLSPRAFAPGAFRRTRLAQIPAAIWLDDDTTAQVFCFRSVARYAFDVLSLAAAPGGEVGFFADR